uniref:Putative serine/threonine protein kinase n=1 Tax=Gemmata sp. Wa1-1 TaxID=235140 RepID=Q5EUH0_9BACT|nr:putative serine/threonine protein kinase [Gemmata sp. Wa1-1]
MQCAEPDWSLSWAGTSTTFRNLFTTGALMIDDTNSICESLAYVNTDTATDRRTNLGLGDTEAFVDDRRSCSQATTKSVVAVSQVYELVRELGRGMYGEVWLARKRSSGIERAIKVLFQPAACDAARRELKSLELVKNLRHPRLLATEDFWVTNNRLYIVMELADGTLRGRLKHYQREGLPGIPADELFRYIAEAAEGLDYLHDRKITHRDVKPDNILFIHGHAKVADFGLARAYEQPLQSMSFVGSPMYLAPEMWGCKGGPASDQYSLAVSYVELRQGRPPLPPLPLLELMVAHQEGRFEFAGHISAAEQVVLRRAMASAPGNRYPSCRAFVTDLMSVSSQPRPTRISG